MLDESADGFVEAKLYRTTSLPVKMLGSERKLAPVPEKKTPAKKAKKAKKIHPLFGLFDKRTWKKTTSDPAFSRYMEYVKEGSYKI